MKLNLKIIYVLLSISMISCWATDTDNDDSIFFAKALIAPPAQVSYLSAALQDYKSEKKSWRFPSKRVVVTAPPVRTVEERFRDGLYGIFPYGSRPIARDFFNKLLSGFSGDLTQDAIDSSINSLPARNIHEHMAKRNFLKWLKDHKNKENCSQDVVSGKHPDTGTTYLEIHKALWLFD